LSGAIIAGVRRLEDANHHSSSVRRRYPRAAGARIYNQQADVEAQYSGRRSPPGIGQRYGKALYTSGLIVEPHHRSRLQDPEPRRAQGAFGVRRAMAGRAPEANLGADRHSWAKPWRL